MSTKAKLLLILFLQLILILEITGQANQQLKYVMSGKNANVVQPQFDSMKSAALNPPFTDIRNTGPQFTKASVICTRGMWALYNFPNWGEGIDDPSQIQVISVRGQSISECTAANAITQLKNVQSLNFLGAGDFSNALTIYTENSFVGGRWQITDTAAAPPGVTFPAGMNGYRMGSFAITGNLMWIICGDAACTPSYAVCVDMTMQTTGPMGMYLVRNTNNDTTTTWPRVVRGVQIGTAATCAAAASPPAPTVSSSQTRSVAAGKPNKIVGRRTTPYTSNGLPSAGAEHH